MTQTMEAVYDGSAIHPDEPLQLKANTRLRIVIESLPEDEPQSARTGEATSFLDTALSLNLEGLPPDFSANVDHYLYGHRKMK